MKGGDYLTNTVLLSNRIRQSGYKLQFLAERCGLDPKTLRRKIQNESEFKQTEITVLRELLKLSDADCNAIFFADCVDKTST